MDKKMDCESLLVNLSTASCRICFQTHENIHSLYDEVDYGETGVELKEILQCVSNAEISLDDPVVPTCLCFDCTEKLLNAYEFVSAVKKSEKVLEKYIQENRVENVNIAHIEKISSNAEDGGEDFEILDAYRNLLNDSEDVDTNVDSTTNLEVQHPIDTEQILKDSRLTAYNSASCKHGSSHGQNIGTRLSSYAKTNRHECEKCQRSFAKLGSLQRHITVAHTYIPAEKIAAIAPKPNSACPIRCAHCPRIFARNENLQRHLRLVHPDVKKDEQDQQKVYKRGLCPHCGVSFPISSLKVHIRRHTGEKPYKCDSCDKAFPRRQDLDVHRRQHTGERPHICTFCGKSFIRPNKLSRHMRIHTGVRPYKCTICSKCFSQSNDLKLHFRRHSGEKPYKCGICSEAYISGTALKNHRKQKSHYESGDVVDPYEKCRVNARICNKFVTQQEQKLDMKT